MSTTYFYDLEVFGKCYITVPTGFDFNSLNVPLVFYFHGSGGAPNDFASSSKWKPLRDWLNDAGWVVVEGTGGGENSPLFNDGFSWGNQSGRDSWMACLDKVESIINVGTRVLLGRSMGGLASAWFYTLSDRASDFDGWINNSAVSTMLEGTTGGSGANTATKFSSHVFPAFGFSYDTDRMNYPQVVDAIRAINAAPEEWDISVWAGKKILCVYGDADDTVYWVPNGGGAMLSKWSDAGAEVSLTLVPGGTHNPPGSYYSNQAMVAMTNFLSQFPGSTPVPPIDERIIVVKSRFIKLDEGIHRVHSVKTI